MKGQGRGMEGGNHNLDRGSVTQDCKRFSGAMQLPHTRLTTRLAPPAPMALRIRRDDGGRDGGTTHEQWADERMNGRATLTTFVCRITCVALRSNFHFCCCPCASSDRLAHSPSPSICLPIMEDFALDVSIALRLGIFERTVPIVGGSRVNACGVEAVVAII